MKKARYVTDGGRRYLVLEIASSGLKKQIPAEDVGRWACDHDDLISDCGRCWDCGKKRMGSNPPLNWALPRKE